MQLRNEAHAVALMEAGTAAMVRAIAWLSEGRRINQLSREQKELLVELIAALVTECDPFIDRLHDSLPS